MTAVRFAISIPQLVVDGFDPDEFRAYLARAEELGFESGWTLEQVLGTAPMLNPTETLTSPPRAPSGSASGCVVYVSTLHGPVHLAKSLSTLDQLSQGRLEVGVGTGGQGRMFSAFAVDPATLVSRFTESLQLIKALWTEPAVTFDGRFWQLDGAAMEPKPVQKPHPPIWFGANHPAALRRAVRFGDGFFGAGSSTTARFVEQVGVVRERARRDRTRPGELPHRQARLHRRRRRSRSGPPPGRRATPARLPFLPRTGWRRWRCTAERTSVSPACATSPTPARS